MNKKCGDLLCSLGIVKEYFRNISELTSKDEIYSSLRGSLDDLEIMVDDLKELHRILYAKLDGSLVYSDSLTYSYMMEHLIESISSLTSTRASLVLLSKSLMNYDKEYPIE